MNQTPAVPTRPLNTGRTIPLLGLGTAGMTDDEAAVAVRGALRMGYRLVDTASRYGNETGVGRGIRDSGVPREEIVVTTKLRGADHGYDTVRTALHASLDRLGLE
ncbi:MAG TPA: aldo/keto reductase, partial [Pseudonocardiaceae bacterium]|nr:aldo/keto reductase [Pseudonocardiaceae bacterium]